MLRQAKHLEIVIRIVHILELLIPTGPHYFLGSILDIVSRSSLVHLGSNNANPANCPPFLSTLCVFLKLSSVPYNIHTPQQLRAKAHSHHSLNAKAMQDTPNLPPAFSQTPAHPMQTSPTYTVSSVPSSISSSTIGARL